MYTFVDFESDDPVCSRNINSCNNMTVSGHSFVTDINNESDEIFPNRSFEIRIVLLISRNIFREVHWNLPYLDP